MRNNKTVNILFLGGAKRVSLGERFIYSAKKLGVKLNIFSYELDKCAPIASLAKVIIGLRWSDKAVLQHLSGIITQFNINIALPFVDQACMTAAALKEKDNRVFVPVSPTSVCKLFFNKIKSNKWFIKNDFPVPNETVTTPLIAKPRNGSASKNIIIIKNKKDLALMQDRLISRDYLIQRFINGREYSVDCYVSMSGDIISIVPRKRLDVSDGEVIKSVTVRDQVMNKMSKKIISCAGLRGPITIQFIRENESGKTFIMEVNPRFAGGVILSIAAGADIPEMILHEYLGIPNKPFSNWKENLLMSRAYREYFYETNY